MKRTIFLFDGVGALVSAVFLFAFMPAFPELFATPVSVSRFLGAVAAILAAYSGTHFIRPLETWRWNLGILIAANLLYAIGTAIVAYSVYDPSKWDSVYFALEIAAILVLVGFEIKVFRSATPA